MIMDTVNPSVMKPSGGQQGSILNNFSGQEK
jgi:hypothetical protein